MRFNVVLFMLIVALLGGLSTCSSEVPIGFDTDELSFDMSLVLLTGDMQTKASDPNYTYATTEELTIQNCHVAVFDKDGKRIYFKNFYSKDLGEMKTIGNLSGYELQLEGVRTFGKEDKKVSVLVMANANNANNSPFDNLTTYDGVDNSYTAKTIAKGPVTASLLVKIGKSETTLKYNQDNAPVTVSLIQLSAKIEYTGVYKKENGELLEGFSLTKVAGLNASSKITIFNTSAVENGAFSDLAYPTTKPVTFYTYEISDAFKEVILSVQSGVEPKEYPFPANKFIKGNYYRIKGLKSSTEIEWVLENVEDKEVTLDPFE